MTIAVMERGKTMRISNKEVIIKRIYGDKNQEVGYEEVAELVRCKDCKWWTKQEDSLQGRCALIQSYPTGAWYCADGEKKDESDTADND